VTDILISNERWKAFSNLGFTLCAVLVTATVARIWERNGLDAASSFGFIATVLLGFLSWRLLGFLVPES
jgi:hypothetical protein